MNLQTQTSSPKIDTYNHQNSQITSMRIYMHMYTYIYIYMCNQFYFSAQNSRLHTRQAKRRADPSHSSKDQGNSKFPQNLTGVCLVFIVWGVVIPTQSPNIPLKNLQNHSKIHGLTSYRTQRKQEPHHETNSNSLHYCGRLAGPGGLVFSLGISSGWQGVCSGAYRCKR